MAKEPRLEVDVGNELLGLGGDPRLERRAGKMLRVWQEKPGLGFPQVFDSDAELEAAYRFFGNASLDFETLVAPHVGKTLERCRGFPEVVCIQDTTTFVFSGERQGLGYINKNNRGFLGHFALATSRSSEQCPIPLGVVGAKRWVRTLRRKDKAVSQHKLRESGDSESTRWLETVEETEKRLDGVASPIHVMDREGHIYDCIAMMVARKHRFVVRCMGNRCIVSDDPEVCLLFDALEGLPVRYRAQVNVTPRKASHLPDQKKVYPDRDGRQAEVCVTATTVCLKRTRNSAKNFPATTTVNVVHVFEPCSPSGQEPVEWILLTNEPVATVEDVRTVIDLYRQRWLIEELFKSIKTGCAFEKRQLESYDALSNALALTVPIAWGILLLRAQSRVDDSAPAGTFIDPLRIELIRIYSKRYRLPAEPTLRDVAYGIAAMGGHLKRNGHPGWLTLRRGFERLLVIEDAWIMSRRTCDQS